MDSCLHRGRLFIHLSVLRRVAYMRSCQSVGAVSESEWTGGAARCHLSSVTLCSLLPALLFLPQSPVLVASLLHDLLRWFHVTVQAVGIFDASKKNNVYGRESRGVGSERGGAWRESN